MKSLLLLLIITVFWGCSNSYPRSKTGFEGKLMPSFNLLLMDSITNFSTERITDTKPIVLLFFSPECPYCKALVSDIKDNINVLSEINFIFLSNFSFATIKSFYNHYKLQEYSNILVGQDYEFYFPQYYKATIVPFIVIYGRDKKVNTILHGRVNPTVIRDIAMQ